MNPDLEKLRRFALASGLVLIVYSLAAVELDTGEAIHPLGIPLKINRPEYLGIGLVIASLWGMFRFLYYGAWKTESPARKRTPLLKALLQKRPEFSSLGDVEKWADNLRRLLPRLPGFRITAESRPKRLEEEGPSDLAVISASRLVVDRINIPWPFYVAARIEDIDYFAPVWLNVAALGLWGFRLLKSAPWLPPAS